MVLAKPKSVVGLFHEMTTCLHHFGASARRASLFLLTSWLLLLAGCTGIGTKMEDPQVKVAGIRMLPASGFSQPLEIKLSILNPNDRDLSLRGISYAVGIENFEVLTGVSNNLPTLRAYEETPVTVVVTANVVQVVNLLSHLGRNGIGNDVNYHFNAKLDFSAFLPAMRVKESGVFSLNAAK
jgi:LEA14-like dessication related protein